MKALSLLISILIPLATLAQESNKGEQFIQQIEGKLDKAKLTIDKTCASPQGGTSAENWYLKSYIYTEIAKSDVFRASTPGAAKTGLEAVEKCKKLDTERKLESDCINVLFDLSTLFYNNGINLYNSALKSDNTAEYTEAFENFELFFEAVETLGTDDKIVNHLIEHNKINKNSVIVYTAYCAQKAGQIEKAKQYYEKVVLVEETDAKAKVVGVPLGYVYYADLMMAENNPDLAVKIISKASRLYPDNSDVILSAINIFKQSGRVDEMADFLQIASKSSPNDAKILVVLAGANNTIAKDYEKKGYSSTALEYRDKAIKAYEKALSLNPTDKQLLFNINYNLGIIYYNPAVRSYKTQDEANRQEYEYLFRKSLPYLEKAHELDPANRNVMNMMMKAYQTLNETKKAQEIEQLLYK